MSVFARRQTEDAELVPNTACSRPACPAGWIAIVAFGLLFAAFASPRPETPSTGALNVTVQDASGAAVNGAHLELKDLETNDVHAATSKGAGDAVLSFLNPAHYSLTISKDGFETKVYPSVTIQTNQTTDVKVTLVLGSATQTISVSGDSSPLLDTAGNTISTTIDLKQVDNLPSRRPGRICTGLFDARSCRQQLQQPSRRSSQRQLKRLLHHDQPQQERWL